MGIDWKILTSVNQLEAIDQLSNEKPIALFKHSTSCSISAMAKMRLESSWNLDKKVDIYYLDLLNYRNISNAIAEKYAVHHESPQLLLISKGECIYDGSHFDISTSEIAETLDYYNLN